MEEEHFSALDLQIFSPPFLNVADEIWMGEPDIFKPEWSISGRINPLDF